MNWGRNIFIQLIEDRRNGIWLYMAIPIGFLSLPLTKTTDDSEIMRNSLMIVDYHVIRENTNKIVINKQLNVNHPSSCTNYR